MPDTSKWAARKTRWLNRWHARRARRAPTPGGFQSQPEPRTIGSFAKGKQLVAGNLMLAGHLVETGERPPWDIEPPSVAFAEALHGFRWLDDLAALGDGAARARAQDWTFGWIERYSGGNGPGWTPDLAGRRVIRWINHAVFLLSGQGSDHADAFFRSLGQQTMFLVRRWPAASPGLPRFEALTGLIHAGLSLTGMDGFVEEASTALARECTEQIDAEGGIPTRNPEDLLEVFTLLNWAALALAESGRIAPREHVAAIERIAPTLRALRHADGGLARFHGGGRGAEGRLDQALATSGVRARIASGLAMGFARLHGGRTSLIMDAALPPRGDASTNAHASTLAIEITSGRRPLIVSCGSGTEFGEAWHKAGRATPSHSVLGLRGVSSSRLGRGGANAPLVDGPRRVHVQETEGEGTTGIIAGHDGYVASHGLGYLRQIEMTADGRSVLGDESLLAVSDDDKQAFLDALDRTGLSGLRFDLRFHLHPDVDAAIDLGGTAVSMMLRSGEIWVFRYEGAAELALEPSVYLEKGRIKPRATKQVVLSGLALDYATRIRWSLAKAQDTPVALRDLDRDTAGGLP
ncbi:MAG: heparinase [Alphaproteobacteria bacterium]|nr:MAG: heparinase [Alphaproteobacteria bacterium]